MPAKTKNHSNKLASHLHLNRCPGVLKPLALLIACTSGLALANPLITDTTGNLSSTLPARKWLISLETGVQSQTTKRV